MSSTSQTTSDAMILQQSQNAITMVLAMILSEIKEKFVPQIKTGYEIVDSVVGALIVCYMGFFLLNFQQNGAKWSGNIIATAYNSIKEVVWMPPIEHQVRISEVDDSSSYHNIYYHSFMWYLGKQQELCDKGKIRLFAGIQQPTDKIVPELGLTCEIKHNEKKITYMIGTDNRWKYVIFGIIDRDVSVIFDFLRKIKADYVAATAAAPSAKEWLQRRYENRNNDWTSIGYTYNTKGFDTVVLDDDDKYDLESLVKRFISGEQWCKQMGVSWQEGILLSGPPGMGKTSLIKAISYTMRRDVYVLDLSTVKDNDQLRNLFQNLPSSAFVVLEDVDCMTDAVHNRDDIDYKVRMDNARQLKEKVVVARALGSAVRTLESNQHGSPAMGPSGTPAPPPLPHPPPPPPVSGTTPMITPLGLPHYEDVDAIGISTGITLDCLLNLLDGLSSCHGLFVVMTTNHPERLDPALIRAGRCNLHIRLKPCTANQVNQFFNLFYKDSGELDNLPNELYKTIPDRILAPAEVFGYFRRHMYNQKRALDKFPEFLKDQLEKPTPSYTVRRLTARSSPRKDSSDDENGHKTKRTRSAMDFSLGSVDPRGTTLIKPWKLPPTQQKTIAAQRAVALNMISQSVEESDKN